MYKIQANKKEFTDFTILDDDVVLYDLRIKDVLRVFLDNRDLRKIFSLEDQASLDIDIGMSVKILTDP